MARRQCFPKIDVPSPKKKTKKAIKKPAQKKKKAEVKPSLVYGRAINAQIGRLWGC